TSTIPIVFGLGSDPISVGLVESWNRPGGNATGVTLLTRLMEPKRLGLLRDLVPGVALVGVFLNPSFPTAERQLQEIEEAARAIDQRIVIAKASTDGELDAAFAALIKSPAAPYWSAPTHTSTPGPTGPSTSPNARACLPSIR